MRNGNGTLAAAASILRLVRPYPWAIPTMLLLGLLASLAEGLGIGLLIPVMDQLIGSGNATESGGVFADGLRALTGLLPAENRFLWVGALVAALVALKAVMMVSNTALTSWVAGRVADDQRMAVAEAVLGMDYAVLNTRESGQTVNLFETQAYRAGESVNELSSLLISGSTVLVFGALLGLLSWQLGLVVILAIIPVSLFVLAMTRHSRRLGEKMVIAHSALSGRVLELISSLKTLRLFNAEREGLSRLSTASDAVRRATLRSDVLTGSIQPVVEFLYVPIFLAVLGYSLHAGISLPTLFAFLALLYRLQNPMKRLDHFRVTLPAFSTGIEALQAIQKLAIEQPAASGKSGFDGLRDRISFEDVGFSYPGESRPALVNLSLEIRRGEIVALVGGSGSGKSTLVNLLCRLYEPAQGRILVDGRPLAELDTARWRSRIALSGQDIELIDGSVKENLCLGAADISDHDIVAALRSVLADEFVSGREAGLDASVGPQGRRLSGGQRQRIALARAMVRRPDILILDEATNAVDSHAGSEIERAIEALAGRCTIVVIAHSLATISRAQQVVVLSDGQVVEIGSPRELLARDGALSRLFEAR